jgi:DNA primase
MSEKNKIQFIGFDRLKEAVSIEQVLGRYGLLEGLRRSGDSLSGVCPLHRGHNPAQFRVSLSKNCYICFGDCHSGGSIVDLVSRLDGVGIREAGLRLQEWFGLEPANGNKPTAGRVTPHEEPHREQNSSPRMFNPPLCFELGPLDEGHPYLNERGLSAETITAFGLGGCARGSLRGWIAIPIHDANGRLVAYAGRWPGVPTEGISKYRLPRGFRKSLELFNQHRAATESGAEPLVVVEGFFGCMRVWQTGHKRVVSLMGSMLSKAQEQRIVELAGSQQPVLLLFDGDEAGRKGALGSGNRLRQSVRVEVLHLTDGQQPDSLAAEELRQLIDQSRETKEAA